MLSLRKTKVTRRCKMRYISFILLNNLSSSSDETGSSGSNETTLSTSGGISSNSRWMTDMLMVTTTMRMLDWVHGDTSNSWPVLSFTLHLEPGGVSLKEWLINSLATSADTNHSSAHTVDGLSGSGWESDSSLLTIIGVTNDDS